eukprot:CAMPEP_0202363820 /NCGR_PEP_ID=MMETSP1126-20121109/15461_1 /ASSEMBLY_ACC=CAM_ASM_000457 /TAXON_ID=3047 /ORGANISM="Dunaliella tertiolecta, Strain CCMP1320" /LENGTH=62 /DNA_ID=CAMNT_0048958311 /DNA_START=202 /DNA_END=390 /DNA_ORIENTATION=-
MLYALSCMCSMGATQLWSLLSMAADIVHLAKGDAWLDTRRGFTAHQGYKAGSANRSPTALAS